MDDGGPSDTGAFPMPGRGGNVWAFKAGWLWSSDFSDVSKKIDVFSFQIQCSEAAVIFVGSLL